MKRKQFTFYESFFDAVCRIKKDADRAKAYDAICAYALREVIPDLDKMPDSSAIAFELIRPNLDASRRKAQGGKLGGSAKQEPNIPEASGKDNASIQEANAKRGESASEKEGEIEEEGEIEIENECYPPAPLTPTGSVASVLADYLNRINPTASPMSLDELKGYAEELGEAVCKRAFDIALDSKKSTWPYIRAILRDKQAKGVRCLADWEASEIRIQEKPAHAEKPKRKTFSELIAEERQKNDT